MLWISHLRSFDGGSLGPCAAVSFTALFLGYLPYLSNVHTSSVVEALRTILFGTYSRIGLEFGILFTWIGVSIAFYPFANYIMQWKQKRGVWKKGETFSRWRHSVPGVLYPWRSYRNTSFAFHRTSSCFTSVEDTIKRKD